MRVCVVGAGAAGLAAARRCTDAAYADVVTQTVVYEQADRIGGTWVYTDKTGIDEYGLPIHTSMYKQLRTNLPKEVMGYPDFPIEGSEDSYITQQQILDFLESYTDNFNLRSLIKFRHHVKNIEPTDDGKWLVTVIDLKQSSTVVEVFDGIMICNGHYHTPSMPHLPGEETFTGRIMHSHDYRDSEHFTGRRVLVIGAGPSGMDLALQICKYAEFVVLSHHSRDEIATVFPENVQQKPDVHRLEGSMAVFNDGTQTKIDTVIFCTGYLYSFPFLSEKCGIKVTDNHVNPLYKHLININHPTMSFIGLPFYVCAFSMFDLQCRFYLEYMAGRMRLPEKEVMLDEMNQWMSNLYASGLGNKHAHMMGVKQGDYYLELSTAAQTTPIPPVLTILHNESSRRFNEDLVHFRNDVYRIVDYKNYEQLN